MEEYYSLLGVDSSDSEVEIKKAFLAKKSEAQKDLLSRDAMTQKKAAERISSLTKAYKAIMENTSAQIKADESAQGVTESKSVTKTADSVEHIKNKEVIKEEYDTQKRIRKQNNESVAVGEKIVDGYQHEERSNKALIIFLGIIIVLLLCYIAYAVTKTSKPVKQIKQQSQVTQQNKPVMKKDKDEQAAMNEFNSRILKYDQMRKKYDQDITDNAEAINKYVAAYGDLKNAHKLLAQCIASEIEIKQTYERFLGEPKKDKELTNLMMNALELEKIRARSLCEGVRNGIAGGEFSAAFKYGTDASYRYEDLEKTLNAAMLRRRL